MTSRHDMEPNRPCIRCAAPTCSHTDYPLCGVCFRYLSTAYCGPRHLTDGIRDGMAALDRCRAFHGLTGPPPTNEVWGWLLSYLAARGAYARLHRGRLPPTGPASGVYTSDHLRRVVSGGPEYPGRDRTPAPG